MLEAYSVKNNVILKFGFNPALFFNLERTRDGKEWAELAGGVNGFYTDYEVEKGLYQYRCRNADAPDAKWQYSICVRVELGDPLGYTFGNYRIPEGSWGEVITVDDMRYTYLWGVDFRASNGQPYTDAQVRFHINSSIAEMERRLDVTIKKTRCVTDAERRKIPPEQWDEDEGVYSYRRERVQRTGMINTRRRPVIAISKLEMVTAYHETVIDLIHDCNLNKTRGFIQFFNRPLKASDSQRGIMNSVYPYGAEQFDNNLYYDIDYTAGFENSDKVPADLRAAIGKMCAIELLNIIGDGLLAGFSSSSLSMDGVSESFNSTQSATSATYGARILEYGKELDAYIKANKMKFGNTGLGAL
jgi:hypothetical protein